MANIIDVSNLTKSFTGRKLFREASFSVQSGEKIGIVGINGTGKSTLLKILANAEEPDAGEVICANHIVMNYLSQTPSFSDEHGALAAVLAMAGQKRDHDVDFYTVESEAKSLLDRFGITDWDQPVREMSGGQRKRLALAAAVLRPCDVLLLDEPTNHLDYEMIEWLENYLRSFRGTILMVTHDRYFLDSVCSRIVEIDKGSIYSYAANYSGFLEAKTAREESERATERKRQSILRKEIEWMQRGARARSTKQKAHIQRYENLRDQKGPAQEAKLDMASVSTRLGRTTIELDHVSKSFGDKVCVDDFSYVFLKNDRIGFVGKNGCGKTTLMKMIAGLLSPDQGKIVIGQTVKIGYYCQEIRLTNKKETTIDGQGAAVAKNAEIASGIEVPFDGADVSYMNPSDRVIDYIRNTAEYVKTEDGLVSASAMLERFLFPPEEQYGRIEKLSGGERRRLNLLRVLMEAPNILILDEPTNDLDTETLAILEDYLDSYDGIVITVSHDRYFLDRIVSRIFAFEGDGRIVQYEGGYTDYMAKRPETPGKESAGVVEGTGDTDVSAKAGAAVTQTADAGDSDSRSTWKHEQKVRFTFKEAKEYETIEADITAIEEKIADIEQQMRACATDAGKLNALLKEQEEWSRALEEKLERWEYLENKKAQI
jgi:ATP-binding cassette subfamily F protein uup